jgi:hypothetical protein
MPAARGRWRRDGCPTPTRRHRATAAHPRPPARPPRLRWGLPPHHPTTPRPAHPRTPPTHPPARSPLCQPRGGQGGAVVVRALRRCPPPPPPPGLGRTTHHTHPWGAASRAPGR